ncbi:MAG: hypothetical protein HS113_09190 [Verrucomicrobiales bacterium]|nr:hypothetical protein [Verrucomicrobiales bacterium]
MHTCLTGGAVAFGATLADRLRVLEGNGLLVRKWETYDLGFWQGGYEWGPVNCLGNLRPAAVAAVAATSLVLGLIPPTAASELVAVQPLTERRRSRLSREAVPVVRRSPEQRN